jgi:peptidoglycan/LPS O-acetylase OafA/YrhL
MILISYVVYWFFEKHGYKAFPLDKWEAKLAMHWSPLPYCFSFCSGIAAYQIRKKSVKTISTSNAILFSSILLIFLYSLYPSEKIQLLLMTAITFFVIAFENGRNTLMSKALCSPVMIYLGTISYGIYLSHMPIIVGMRNFGLIGETGSGVAYTPLSLFGVFCAVSVASIIISAITYVLIENNTGKIGKTFYEKISAQQEV